MKKVTETTVVTAKGAELRAFIESGVVKVETPVGTMTVESVYSPRGNVKAMTYSNEGKKMQSEIKAGSAMLAAMLNCVKKEGRDLYIETADFELSTAEGFGATFTITESSSEYYTAAYKYN